MPQVIRMQSNLYDMVSVHPNRKEVLFAAGLKESSIPRYRDVDVPPYKRYRQLPIFTDTRFKEENLDNNKNSIIVLTRIGGGNRETFKDWWEQIKKHPNYITDYDSNADSTYAFIEFGCNEETMNQLKELDNNHEPDIDRVTKVNIETAFMLAKMTGQRMNEADKKKLEADAKRVALEIIHGDVKK